MMRRRWPFNQRELKGDSFDHLLAGGKRLWMGDAKPEQANRWLRGTSSDVFLVSFIGLLASLLMLEALDAPADSVLAMLIVLTFLLGMPCSLLFHALRVFVPERGVTGAKAPVTRRAVIGMRCGLLTIGLIHATSVVTLAMH